jgi:hypothetical protein
MPGRDLEHRIWVFGVVGRCWLRSAAVRWELSIMSDI